MGSGSLQGGLDVARTEEHLLFVQLCGALLQLDVEDQLIIVRAIAYLERVLECFHASKPTSTNSQKGKNTNSAQIKVRYTSEYDGFNFEEGWS